MNHLMTPFQTLEVVIRIFWFVMPAVSSILCLRGRRLQRWMICWAVCEYHAQSHAEEVAAGTRCRCRNFAKPVFSVRIRMTRALFALARSACRPNLSFFTLFQYRSSWRDPWYAFHDICHFSAKCLSIIFFSDAARTSSVQAAGQANGGVFTISSVIGDVRWYFLRPSVSSEVFTSRLRGLATTCLHCLRKKAD